jgi:uncharacterized protein YkwD
MGVLLTISVACSQPQEGGSSQPSPSPSPPPSGTLEVTTADLEFCVSETNRYRAMRSKAPVTRSTALETFAHDAAVSDAASNIPHNYYRSHATGISAENQFIAGRQSNDTIRSTIQFALAVFWGEGPGGGHYENMIGPYTQVGCGFAIEANRILISQDFR